MTLSSPQLALFLASAHDGAEAELRLSLVAEHLELEGPAFTQWLEQHTDAGKLQDAPDDDLVHLYQTFEDHHAFEELLRRHEPLIRSIIARIVRTPDAVDEVYQEYQISMIQALYKFEFNSRVSTYAYRVAHNEALMWLRSSRRGRLDSDETALQTAQADPHPHGDHMLRTRILQAVSQLPEQFRHPFMARHFRHMNIEEGSQELGISPGLFRQRLHRARLHLRGMLRDVAP